MPETIIVIAVLALLIGGAVLYVVRSRKKGIHCIGCPHAKSCAKGSCACRGDESNEKKD